MFSGRVPQFEEVHPNAVQDEHSVESFIALDNNGVATALISNDAEIVDGILHLILMTTRYR